MPTLTAEKLIIAFHKLSIFLNQPDEDFNRVTDSALNHNAWFQPEEVKRSLSSLQEMLQPGALEKWFEQISVTETPKKIGMILAGNIPMVGFHDILSVLATGNIAMIKLSSSDSKLLPILLKQLITFEPALAERIIFAERLKDFDAIIATGSNNSSRYFDYYFGKVPNIIRKNRNSIAVLDGKESTEEIALLGHDIFDYFGLGCRNVSKVYLPEGYEIKNFFEALETFQPIINHFKYNNNYDYNKSIFLVNGEPHFDNGFLLLKEDKGLSSPLAVLYFEYYKNIEELNQTLGGMQDQIQCIVSHADLKPESDVVSFGQSQHPQLWDYADNVNTVAFLNSL
ncbi:Acyl-CoA reductase (LuxC) [Pedobacter westerhofensis]|uniref:Acyl-CoA reductase (LuxC) n=1 Tax=Pedobacter westerhofensis TaxID=425512 RepID=A0A521FPF8_9SPHI|nr:acyl-CoA reductase [Pedobacter westerhofensis]SMO98006.1 Acyl-CoA reductase (LuxC) [Pedobacter westerhofensis]